MGRAKPRNLDSSSDENGFDRFAAFLQGLATDMTDGLIGLETTGHYHLTLVKFLVDAGCRVVLLDPYRAAQFRRWGGHKAKTDRVMLGHCLAS
jgi:transposase